MDNFKYPDNFKEGTKAPANRPDENMVPEKCIEGPDWKTGTCPTSHPLDKLTLDTFDEGQHDEITSVDCSKFGSDYEPNVRRPRF